MLCIDFLCSSDATELWFCDGLIWPINKPSIDRLTIFGISFHTCFVVAVARLANLPHPRESRWIGISSSVDQECRDPSAQADSNVFILGCNFAPVHAFLSRPVHGWARKRARSLGISGQSAHGFFVDLHRSEICARHWCCQIGIIILQRGGGGNEERCTMMHFLRRIGSNQWLHPT